MAERIAVLGAGHGGCAVAADLGRQGHSVSMFSRTQETIQPIIDRGGLEYTGVIGEGFTPLDTVTSSIDEALEGARIIVITTPTTAHGWYAQLLAPRLTDDHIILLNPGHTGGGLHFVIGVKAHSCIIPKRNARCRDSIGKKQADNNSVWLAVSHDAGEG